MPKRLPATNCDDETPALTAARDRASGRHWRARWAVFGVVGVLGLAGCGGASKADPAAAASSAAPTSQATSGSATAPTGSPSPAASEPGRRGGLTDDQLQKITACLNAAGIDVPDLPTSRPSHLADRPSGDPTNLPSGGPREDFPADGASGRPTDMPSQWPTGDRSGGPGGSGAGALFSDEARAALTACGLDLPGAPTPVPTS